nr:reverse transcriptase domain-containing protein [Tanacetum cinerariifolium]
MHSPSSLGSLHSNTISNLRGDLKVITTRSGVSYDGPTIPPTSSPLLKEVEREIEATKDKVQTTSSGSTAHVQPPVVQVPISEPNVAPKPNPKPSIPSEFVVVDNDVDPRVPLILGRPFLRTAHAFIDVYGEELTLRVNDEAITFNVGHTLRNSYRYDDELVNRINVIDVTCEEYAQEGDILLLEKLLINDPSSPLPPKELNFKELKIIKSSINDPPELKLKDLHSHLKYAFLEDTNKLHVIIAKYLKYDEKARLLKLNDATRKDHFPLPFMDQMLERLTGNEYYCFLDGFFGYFQIPIDPQDQEKTTFTCPYGTFAYRRMPFGLCNALVTFQRCVMAIFHDMIEETMEVFMDDFLKCHFMFKEGIVLGHKISKSKIEVDRAKVDVIAKLPHPTPVKEKETPFIFSKECTEAFEIIKKKLTKALILVSLDWDLPFEFMCDASDFAVGAVLGQRKTKHFLPIHYTSKTMTDAQVHYTTIENKLLAVVYAFEKLRSGDLAADHLTRLENPHQGDLKKKEINETLPLETLRMISFHGDHRKVQMNELNKLLDQAYENSLIYKEKTKKIHDSKIKNRVFNVGDRVLLFNS